MAVSEDRFDRCEWCWGKPATETVTIRPARVRQNKTIRQPHRLKVCQDCFYRLENEIQGSRGSEG